MNIVPSDLPRIAGAARLSAPGFDIIRAVSSARQGASPTVHHLQNWAQRECHAAKLKSLRRILCGNRPATEQNAPRVVRFFDLSAQANGLPETMNAPFTRGFQPMLSPSDLEPETSETPPSDFENME